MFQSIINNTNTVKLSLPLRFSDHRLHSSPSLQHLLPVQTGSAQIDAATRLTIEAETVLDGGVGGRRRRRERQGEGLQ